MKVLADFCYYGYTSKHIHRHQFDKDCHKIVIEF